LRFVGGDMGLEKNRKFKSELQRQAEQWGLTEQVQWEGFSERIRDEYIGASFVLNFSDAESFSMTCLESLYYGRAVIATDSGGPAEILGNENAGILVPVAEVTAMRAAIRLLIVNPDLRKEMEQNGYNRARNAFSLNTIINSIRKVYFSACKADSYQ
jgi:glycosyltransferase involved in cell wall biosynthesis